MKSTITVLHAINPTFGFPKSTDAPKVYKEVAKLEQPAFDLEKAYEATNNISRCWLLNEGVTSQLTEARSTSVDDVFEHEARYYRVERRGFGEIDKPEIVVAS